MKKLLQSILLFTLCLCCASTMLVAQDRREAPPPSALDFQARGHFGSSPFDPPEQNDTTFVVDQDIGLDTGCTFRDGGPLIFNILVDRVVGDVAQLKANGLISATARLQMPAFDVDFDAVIAGINPERDRISFNGNVVPTEFLTGANDVWKLNSFNVPIEWVNFASDPGANGQAQAVINTVRIDIDVANSSEEWCTAIDWASLEFDAARPVVMAHGILSDGSVWDDVWVPRLNSLGILTDNNLNMGNLDSIGNNATKIGNVVQRARTRWGVDKVHLVCHSKGGLDARHYAETHETVDQVVQLGTPNAGSPLADLAQVGALVLVGPLGTIIANTLAGPAGVQLTRPYMTGYNLVHGANPNVQYTALAGDYDPDCFVLNPFCRPLERMLLAITGRGDTIVPVSSVHALNFTLNRTFTSAGSNKDATHTALERSLAVFNATSDRVRGFGRATTLNQPEFVRSTTVGGEISLGETKTHQLPVDETGPLFMSLMYPEGSLDLVLISPSGRRIDAATAANDSEVEYDEGDILGGRMTVFALAGTETGFWTLEVTAAALDSPSVGYAANAWIEEPAVTFTGSVGREALNMGSSLELFATVQEDGAPMAGATVEARVVAPDDSMIDITLVDDGTGVDATAGDGTYSGALDETSQSGFYRVAFMASGTNSAGAPCSREDFAVVSVSSTSSSFASTFRDFGRDTDADGLFNELVIEVDLDLEQAMEYRIFGILEDSLGNTHETQMTADLDAGLKTVELVFDGEALFRNRVNGPYTLSRVVLVEEDDFLVLPVAELTDAHQSASYSFLQFEHGSIELTGEGLATGVDLNGNGRFDRLDVALEVELDRADVYSWSAQLVDENGIELGFSAGSEFLSAGRNDLNFSFEGEGIGANGVDGPYIVTSLLVFGSSTSLVANDAFATPAFQANEFEGMLDTLTLRDGRFQVEVEWRDFDGASGTGAIPTVPATGGGGAVELRSEDSAVLEFFRADNWELLVKVVDARSFNGRFWVFQAAATDVEFTTTVTDTSCGAVKTYFNPLGVAAPAVADTDAFIDCAQPQPPTCIPAADTICLGEDGRFQLEVSWVDHAGETGVGRQVEIPGAGPAASEDSGLFYFFEQENWELLVKVLDGCALTNHFWVFSAATTNVEYTLKVTDTETGVVRRYTNPLGAAAAALNDTRAFATCPGN